MGGGGYTGGGSFFLSEKKTIRLDFDGGPMLFVPLSLARFCGNRNLSGIIGTIILLIRDIRLMTLSSLPRQPGQAAIAPTVCSKSAS